GSRHLPGAGGGQSRALPGGRCGLAPAGGAASHRRCPGDAAVTPGQPLPWQQGVWASLTSQIDLDRLPHALLLSGPAGIGKKHLALSLAQRLLCATPLAGKACGQCRQCLLMAAGSHPDFLLVEPEERSEEHTSELQSRENLVCRL